MRYPKICHKSLLELTQNCLCWCASTCENPAERTGMPSAVVTPCFCSFSKFTRSEELAIANDDDTSQVFIDSYFS